MIQRLLSILNRLSSILNRLSSILNRLSSIFNRLLSIFNRLLSILRNPKVVHWVKLVVVVVLFVIALVNKDVDQLLQVVTQLCLP